MYNPSNSPSQEATEWVGRTQAGPLSSEDRMRLHAWLEKDPANRMEWDIMNAIWSSADVLQEDPLVIRETRLKSRKRSTGSGLKWLAGFGLSSASVRVAAAAAIVLIVAAVWLTQPQTLSTQTYATVVGEQRIMTLSDGSTVHLDTQTTITAAFSEKARDIALKTGRASFFVMHEPERPFVVIAGNVRVTALGTEFSVYKERRGRVSVEVTKGSVRVDPEKANPVTDDSDITEPVDSPVKTNKPDRAANADHAARSRHRPEEVLSAGQKIVVDEQKAEYVVETIDTKQAAEWRKGRLIFGKQPLADVIDEINRYMEREITIGDDSIKDIQVSMVFNVRDRKFFLPTLEGAIPYLASKQSPDGRSILIRKEGS